MPQPENKKSFAFDRPGNYRIRVEGFLDESWSDRLGGLRISTSSGENEEAVTTLSGRMTDQAALAGVLHTLYDHHLTLLSVEYIKGD